MLWFAHQVGKYLNETVESYCKSVDIADFYILSGWMDLTYSLDTLLILFAAITCLSLGFKHSRRSSHSTVDVQ